MEVQSLAYRTDLIFPKFEGEIIDRGPYLVVLTPSNPTFHWGNFLLFPDPPGRDDFDRWQTIFAREISSRLEVEHMAFGWDTVEGELGQIEPFLEAGFNLNQAVVLATQQVKMPPKYNREVTIRPIEEDWEWEQAIETQIACRPPEFSLQEYQVFKRNQMAHYRQMTRAGLGVWVGAFLENRLVADLGVFVSEKIGRFQSVETHPDYRRRGICGTLVYQASRYAFEQLAANTLVMVADESYHAAKIYESVGFKPKEHQVGVDWWDNG